MWFQDEFMNHYLMVKIEIFCSSITNIVQNFYRSTLTNLKVKKVNVRQISVVFLSPRYHNAMTYAVWSHDNSSRTIQGLFTRIRKSICVYTETGFEDRKMRGNLILKTLPPLYITRMRCSFYFSLSQFFLE